MSRREMKAAVIEGHGDVGHVHIRTWLRPEPEPGHVLVQIAACALNYLDIFVRRGMPDLPVILPRIGGGDIAGTVCEVGSGVDSVWIGKRVVLFPRLPSGGILGEHANGGLCEFISVDERQLIEIPASVDFNRAAALPIAYGTAHRMLFTKAQLAKGERIFILGASGGVGAACVQLAKMIGAEVFAGTSSEEKAKKLRILGVDHVIVHGNSDDFSKEVWTLSEKKGVDVAVNFTGDTTWIPTLRVMARNGRIVTCGSTANHLSMIDIRFVWHRELQILGSRAYLPSDTKAIINFVSQGRLDPVIDSILPLEEIRYAMTLLEDRHVFGKVILNP